MQDVRLQLGEQKVVRWSFGCAAYALNNICEETIKECFVTKKTEALFVANTVRLIGTVRIFFDFLCEMFLKALYYGFASSISLINDQLDAFMAFHG